MKQSSERFGTTPKFGLYVHWPFCATKCPYCDFNSHVVRSVDHGAWADALCAEIERSAGETQDAVLETIFIGGGTPSLMAPETVRRIIATAKAAWRCSNDMEITMEANPGSVDARNFAACADAGVNRISLGIQSLNDTDLRRLGRLHDAAAARDAIKVAKSSVANVNLDLIYGRQGQTLEAWQDELVQALDYETEHLSLYQLTVEDGTVFAERFRAGQLKGLPDEDLASDLYLLTQEVTKENDRSAYEVSNHAKPGFECRHNLIYWSAGQYVGIGPGAHGRIHTQNRRFATEAIRDPAKWLLSVRNARSGEKERTLLLPNEQIEEAVLMGLRLRQGVSVALLSDLGVDLPKWIALRELIEQGLVLADGGFIRTTPHGHLLANAITAKLLAEVPLSQS